MCSFNRGNIEGTNSSEICVQCLCMYVLCLQSDWFCRLNWQRVDIYICEKSLEMCICLWVWLSCVVDRTLKSNYYYYSQRNGCSIGLRIEMGDVGGGAQGWGWRSTEIWSKFSSSLLVQLNSVKFQMVSRHSGNSIYMCSAPSPEVSPVLCLIHTFPHCCVWYILFQCLC